LDNKQELPDVQIAEPAMDEAINRDFITEKIELSTPDNKPELPEKEVQIRATDPNSHTTFNLIAMTT
jgi:hypothetical protein